MKLGVASKEEKSHQNPTVQGDAPQRGGRRARDYIRGEVHRAPTGAGLLGIIATCGVKAGVAASGQGASCPFSVRVATEAE